MMLACMTAGATLIGMARPQPTQQPPPVQRLRLRYAKRGTARFASHRDFSRALERALRRAKVPMAYSSGFSPHPRISYAGAAPTGTGSEAEYLELGLAEHCDPGELADALTRALPEGFPILRAVEASGGPLTERLAASEWAIELPGVAADALPRLAGLLWDAEMVEVSRLTKKGERRFDARQAVVKVWVAQDALHVVLRHTEPLVRPDDVFAALQRLAPQEMAAAGPPRATRLRQGPLVVDTVGGPFEGST